MSFRNPFRRKEVLSLKDTSNNKEKDFIRKISTVSHLRLRLSPKSKFRIIENLTLSSPAATLELIDYPGHVMRARGMQLIGEKRSHDQEFTDDSTFYLMSDLWFDGFIAFESTKIAAHYIRLRGNSMELSRYDGSIIFKEECSFKMKSDASSQANDGSFQNNWVEENGNIGLQLDKKSSILSKASPSTRSGKFLMVPVKKGGTLSVSEDETSSQRSSPCSDNFKRENKPGRKCSDTFPRQKFLSTSPSRDFIWKYNNSAYENSPMSSHKSSAHVHFEENCHDESNVDIPHCENHQNTARDSPRKQVLKKGKLIIQNSTADRIESRSVQKEVCTTAVFNDTVNHKLEQMKNSCDKYYEKMNTMESEERLGKLMKTTECEVKISNYKDTIPFVPTQCLTEDISKHMNRINHHAFKEYDNSLGNDLLTSDLRKTESGKGLVGKVNGTRNTDFDRSKRAANKKTLQGPNQIDEIELSDIVRPTSNAVYLYCLADDDDDDDGEKEDSSITVKTKQDVELALLERQRIGRRIPQSHVYIAQGRLIAKRMEENRI